MEIIYLLITTHITIAMVTIYLHRAMSHRSMRVSKGFDRFARIWLWLTTGQVTTQWVAVHRKHHAKCETEEDPHSPQKKGLWTVLFKGVWLYKNEARNPETIAKYSLGCPTDRLEQFFMRHSMMGLVILFFIDTALFSYQGLWIYLVQILWIPFWAAGVVNGVGHFVGYRNFTTKDASTNISPWGIVIGGEELHNNHHAYPTSAKLSMRPWEFDIGWAYIRALSAVGLVSDVRQHALPQTHGLQDFLQHQSYYRRSIDRGFKYTVKTEIEKIQHQFGYSARKLYKMFLNPQKNSENQRVVSQMLAQSPKLAHIFQMKEKIVMLWEDKKLQLDDARVRLQDWIAEARAHYAYELRRVHFMHHA